MKQPASIRHEAFWVAVVLGLSLLSAREVFASAPNYVSDPELAAYPIIVVAKWDKVPVTDHSQYYNNDPSSNTFVTTEYHTKLNVLGVVKGKIGLGQHDLLFGWGISWDDDGTELNSGSSTQIAGDVDDITKPCLWFLKRAHSWDPKLKQEFLKASNYREVQPLKMKELYVALGGPNPELTVPKLLVIDKPDVAEHVLSYICGGLWPWPYEFDDKFSIGVFGPETRGPLLPQQSGRVWDYLQSTVGGRQADREAVERARCFAASVYAELAGKECVAKMRTLLGDPDADVRTLAVGILARYRDADSLSRFANATDGSQDPYVACKTIKQLSDWKDDRVIPTLIRFLQDDGDRYWLGDIGGVPAICARQALAEITGHEFPYDVSASQKAWLRATQIVDKAARERLLEELAPGHTPLTAVAVGLPGKKVFAEFKKYFDPPGKDDAVVQIRIRNVSTRPVAILKHPSRVEADWTEGCRDQGLDAADSKLEFTTLQPGADMTVEAVVGQSFLDAAPAKRRLRLYYLANGHRQNQKAWIGALDVEFGEAWKYRRGETR